MGLTSAALIAVHAGLLVSLFPLYLANRRGMSPEAIGMLVGLGVLGRLLALWFGGSVSDRWGRLRVLVPALLVYAVLLASVPFLAHPGVLGVWSLAIGGVGGVVAAIPAALIGDRVRHRCRGWPWACSAR
jgi:MFS family permease